MAEATKRTLPTGTLTFLFTDIEGSTKLVRELGDRFDSVLDRHHELLRETLLGSGGVEVATEGDAFFVVFPEATDAVTAAVKAQRALQAEEWGEGIDVRVRMGMHTGTGKLVGDNYGGLDVHRAARISSAGYGAQVLLSGTTRALVASNLPAGTQIIDLGTHRLKDIEDPEALYQLCVDGLRRDFPPPKTLSTTVHNLPATLTKFVAREGVLKEVCELLSSTRILTLTGPGGTGKTRLSLAVAESVVEDFPDGAFVIFLSAVEDEMLVASTIAHALGLREEGDLPIESVLRDHIADKKLLLILDNFEQIIGAASVVSDLIAASPGSKALVTSRIPLHVAGEQEYPVPPMSLPDGADLGSIDVLTEFEALDLFVQRAKAVQPRFELTSENAPAVVEICRKLDGLPLAIELAVARLRLMTPQEMLKRLDAGLMALGGGARDLPARQQTLRGAISWSYDLLDDEQKRFFRAMGVFSGGFTLEAAEAVIDEQSALESIEAMLDNSLLLRTETPMWTTRFRLLQTIREFAIECLEKTGEAQDLHRRHAGYFLSFVEQRAPEFTVRLESLDETEMEYDNFRVALRWAIDSGNASVAMRLASAKWRFDQARSYLAEARRWLTEIVAMPGAAEPTVERGHALTALGSITYWQNDFAATRRYYEEALETFRGTDDVAGLQEALYNSGFLWLLERESTRATEVFEESRQLAERSGDVKGQGNAAWGLAMAAIQRRDLDEALVWGKACGKFFDEIGDLFGRGLANFVEFQVARFTGRYDDARHHLGLYATEWGAGNAEGGASLELIAEVELLAGNYEKAVTLSGAGKRFRDEYGGGSPDALTELTDVKSIVAQHIGAERAEALYQEGRRMEREEAMHLGFGI